MKIKDRCFIVLGMHRSGTSMFSEILHKSGVNMGDRMVAGDWSNPHGHFEDREFVNLNIRMLRTLNASWDNPPEKIDLKKLKPFRKEARQLIRRKNHGYWGWKDPRTLLLWSFWKQYIPKYSVVISMWRDDAAIIKSLKKRNGFTTEKTMEIMKSYDVLNIDCDYIIPYADTFDPKFQTRLLNLFNDVYGIKLDLQYVDEKLNRSGK